MTKHGACVWHAGSQSLPAHTLSIGNTVFPLQQWLYERASLLR